MAFKLSEQIEANPTAAIALYDEYVRNFKNKFPESALNLIRNDKWRIGGQDSEAPHEACLARLELHTGSEADLLILHLEKPWIELTIDISYLGVFHFDLPYVRNATLRYEQIRYFDPYHRRGIRKKMFTHDLEWFNGDVWHITASDIEVAWSRA